MKEQLVETRKRLLEEISGLSFKEFNRTPRPDTWTIGQVAQHLVLTEMVTSRSIAHALKKEDNSLAAAKKIDLILDRSIKVDAPKVVQPDSRQFEVSSVVSMLEESRDSLLDILDKIDPEILTFKSVKHPVFGELPLHQWVELIYLHEQRHIEQIKEIKALLI